MYYLTYNRKRYSSKQEYIYLVSNIASAEIGRKSNYICNNITLSFSDVCRQK